MTARRGGLERPPTLRDALSVRSIVSAGGLGVVSVLRAEKADDL